MVNVAKEDDVVITDIRSVMADNELSKEFWLGCRMTNSLDISVAGESMCGRVELVISELTSLLVMCCSCGEPLLGYILQRTLCS